MVIHSTVFYYIRLDLFHEHSSIQVHVLQLSKDCLHPNLQTTIHSENRSMNHYNHKNSSQHAKNNIYIKLYEKKRSIIKHKTALTDIINL